MGSPPYLPVEAQSLGSPPPKRMMPAAPRDFSQVRADLKEHGRGLLQIPSLYRGAVPQRKEALDSLDLPPKHVADRLLRSYHEHFHLQFPILHWPTFLSECEQLYQTNSITKLGGAWGAVFLCVLACGALYIAGAQDGKALLSSAIGMTDLWQDNFSIQEARMAFLAGVFLMESNLKSASWVWLGWAIRISQDIGLHVDSGAWCPIQREMRRRLWYCIYAWDRYGLDFVRECSIRLMATESWLWSSENPCSSMMQIMTPSIPSLRTTNKSPKMGCFLLDSRPRFWPLCM